MSRSLTITAVEGLPEIQPGDDIIRQIAEALSGLAEPVRNGDIAVVAQKVVSKAHNCFRNLNDIEPRAEALEIAAATDKDPRVVEVVLQESRSIVRQAAGVLIAQHKSGHIMANAGLDRSNVRGDEDHVLVLPNDPDGWCRDAAVAFEAYLGVRMGVVMADSFGRPWRLGTAGVAIGLFGGFTTFSTYMLDIVLQAEAEKIAWAIVLLSATIVIGLLAVLFGLSVGRQL